MQWTILFCLSVLFTYSLSSEVTTILKNGEYNHPFVVDEDIRTTDDSATLSVSHSQRCVRAFIVSLETTSPCIVSVERVSGYNEEANAYTFTEVGSAPALQSQPTTISLSPSPVCGSTWRITVKGARAVFKGVEIFHDTFVSEKRVVTCTVDNNAQYPPECSSASDGAKCLTGGRCGCQQDLDCFGNTDYPFCDNGICEVCGAKGAANNADHLACFPRYPGRATHPTTGDPLPLERAAPLNYYREVCFRGAGGGACQRCNQAPYVDFGLGLTVNQGTSGTLHCSTIKPGQPICMDQTYFNFTGVPNLYNVSLRGACVPCKDSRLCFLAVPTRPMCTVGSGTCGPCATNAQCATFASFATTARGYANCQADGSCYSCRTDLDCGSKDGGEKSNQASCNVATGICSDPFICSVNANCTAAVGNNCQASGLCISCSSNGQCGILDGGEKAGQPVCTVSTGICSDCATNAQCLGTSGANCQKTGQCVTCTSNTQCGTLDGGEVQNQAFCNTVTGICEGPCARNLDCATKPGKNCQLDGSCKSCLSNTDCGATDGGETPGQTQCSIATGICITPFACTNNPSCVGNGGNNCQSDKTCISCTGTATCGPNDGGEVAGQPNCNLALRQCVNACNVNADCVGTQGNNCNKGGICVTCRLNTDCGATDGGEIQGQTICNVATGICESPCVVNADCANKGGKNCQKDGSCFSCSTNSNCGALDGGEAPGQTECNPATGICRDPFKCTTNPSCQGQPGKNCQADLSCKTCTSANDCGVLDGGEQHGQPICNLATGICEFCKSNEECPVGARNCGIDGSCYPCSYAPTGKACGPLDGPPSPVTVRGQLNMQPNCDELLGVCVDGCTRDSHCTADPCKPYCNVDKRCCAECATDAHCPHATWRDEVKQTLTVCSTTTYTCIAGCASDADCKDPNAPACATSLGKCVQCVESDHCASNTTNTPYCHTTDLTCTDVYGWVDNSLSGGAIAGIVIGCIAGILLIIIVTLFIASALGGKDSYSSVRLGGME